LALGFGAFVIATVGLLEASLTREFTLDSGEGRPNLLLFDVQADQRAFVEEFIGSRSSGSPVSTPMVPSRLAEINGTPVEELLDAPRDERPRAWALRRQYRHTYRNGLTGSEELVGGSWWDSAPAADGLARISLEVDLAESLRVGIGDRITWDFAGVPIETRIVNLRSVDWTRFDTNFYAVFEPGTLEEAPQTLVVLTRVEGEVERAQLQRDLIRVHPNISVLDLSRLQQTIDSILSQANQAIRFLGIFSTVAGVLVLVGSLATSRYQRMRESALLKTLGARKKLILQVLTVEYVALGSLATLAGVLLAVVAGRLLAVEVFEVPFRLDLVRMALVWLGITSITVVVGLAGSRGVLRRPPLAVFRDLAG
jgi:putative ABC transport system permease protein